MSVAKGRIKFPLNQAWLERAVALFTEELSEKLDSGQHGMIGIQVEVRDGAVHNMTKRGEVWWKTAEALPKY